MDYIQKWFANLQGRTGLAWKAKTVVIGECKRHMGPRMDLASVTLEFSPAVQFEVTDALDSKLAQRARDSDWYDSIIFGVLDIMLTTPTYPIRDFQLVIRHLEFDEVDSNPMAFRLAARDAAIKALGEAGWR